MASRMSHQFMRNFTIKNIPYPPGFERTGSNLPFNIHKVNTLTVKFILFFSSAFYIPCFALHYQMKKHFPYHNIINDSESVGTYGLVHGKQEEKLPEMYI